MVRPIYLLFGAVAYIIFFATFLYLIAFVGAIGPAPSTIDFGNAELALLPSILIDLGLIALFGVQHSVMARPGFKAAWTRIAPPPIERSIYVVATSLVLILLFLLWRPIPTIVWNIENEVAAAMLWGLFGLGWMTVLLSTFLISHFELFGLKQVWDHWRSKTRTGAPLFRTPFLYRFMRHPLYTGFLLAFWATPRMTIGHLLFAIGMTAYILVAIRYEERDLIDTFGPDYEDYRRNVGMLVPGVGRTR